MKRGEKVELNGSAKSADQNLFQDRCHKNTPLTPFYWRGNQLCGVPGFDRGGDAGKVDMMPEQKLTL